MADLDQRINDVLKVAKSYFKYERRYSIRGFDNKYEYVENEKLKRRRVNAMTRTK